MFSFITPIFFSQAETEYITNFIVDYPSLGAAELYRSILKCPYARVIFHPHHIEIKERIDSKFKQVRNDMYGL